MIFSYIDFQTTFYTRVNLVLAQFYILMNCIDLFYLKKSEINQDVLSSNAGVNEVNFSSNFDASLKIHQRPKTWMKKDAVHGFHQQPSGEIWMFQIVFNHNGILC